ncbi:MAG: hypothetical protein LBN39_11715 [Planctomycetaceae bacterium]|nr:hypothetical protein [Planctomycetaceae bacterium]
MVLLLLQSSGFGQGFADVPAASALEPALISFDEPAPKTAANRMPEQVSPPKEEQVPSLQEKPMPPRLKVPDSTVAGSLSAKNTLSVKTPLSVKNTPKSPVQLQSKADTNHPFARFMDLPKDPNSLIKGKPLTVAQLLNGTHHPVVRKQLLESYWELLGLLVEYNVRRESEQLAGTVRDAQQAQTLNLFQQQRRGTEMEFVKKQYELAELLKRSKGIAVSENMLPLPCDLPVYKPYETYAAQIARTEQARYLGRLLPVQQQLVDAKHKSCEAVFGMLAAVPANSLQLVSQLNQRTESFFEMKDAVVEYNKMIAQYTAETVGPNVSPVQLVGAIIELPKAGEPSDNRRTENATVPVAPKLAAELASPAEQIATEFSLPPRPPVKQVSHTEE